MEERRIPIVGGIAFSDRHGTVYFRGAAMLVCSLHGREAKIEIPIEIAGLSFDPADRPTAIRALAGEESNRIEVRLTASRDIVEQLGALLGYLAAQSDR